MEKSHDHPQFTAAMSVGDEREPSVKCSGNIRNWTGLYTTATAQNPVQKKWPIKKGPHHSMQMLPPNVRKISLEQPFILHILCKYID